jgi:hypothetical protein
MGSVVPGPLAEWNRVPALAVVFGIASVPWTYGFVAGLEIPLWPSFIASATFFAAGSGLDALVRGYASNLAGILYAAATLAIVDGLFGGGVLAFSLVVGGFMFLASLHETIPLLSFTPGAFFGYATMFSVEAAEATAFGVAGLPGETLAAVVSMLFGAVIGLGADELSSRLAPDQNL